MAKPAWSIILGLSYARYPDNLYINDERGAAVEHVLGNENSQKEILLFIQGYKAGRSQGMKLMQEALTYASENAASECVGQFNLAAIEHHNIWVAQRKVRTSKVRSELSEILLSIGEVDNAALPRLRELLDHLTIQYDNAL